MVTVTGTPRVLTAILTNTNTRPSTSINTSTSTSTSPNNSPNNSTSTCLHAHITLQRVLIIPTRQGCPIRAHGRWRHPYI